MDNKFIKVFSDQLAEKLKLNGFVCLGYDGKSFTFLNNGKLLTFSEEDNKNMMFTNIISM